MPSLTPLFRMSLLAPGLLGLLAFPGLENGSAQGTRMLRSPTVSSTHIAFVTANDLWIVGREGGDARRLTSAVGAETSPHFSPDGDWIAFTGQYEGNTDVYVVPASGGDPARLTWHPGADVAMGWTPDGSHVLFQSGREGHPTASGKFFTVPVEGGFPKALPIPRADNGGMSADGAPHSLPGSRFLGPGVAELPRGPGSTHFRRGPGELRAGDTPLGGRDGR